MSNPVSGLVMCTLIVAGATSCLRPDLGPGKFNPGPMPKPFLDFIVEVITVHSAAFFVAVSHIGCSESELLGLGGTRFEFPPGTRCEQWIPASGPSRYHVIGLDAADSTMSAQCASLLASRIPSQEEVYLLYDLFLRARESPEYKNMRPKGERRALSVYLSSTVEPQGNLICLAFTSWMKPDRTIVVQCDCTCTLDASDVWFVYEADD